MSAPAAEPLNSELRRLRIAGNLPGARDLLQRQAGAGASRALQGLLYEHQDFWWARLTGRHVVLERRGPQHAAFVRACWGDTSFMRRFNRIARPLPADDSALRELLARERAGIFSEARSIHWTILGPRGPLGFVSATDLVPGHRRCEFMIGLPGEAPSARAVEAALLAVRFLHQRAGIERLTAYFYDENREASKVAEKFGFRPEGVLRGYIRDADGKRSDLLVSGMVVAEEMASNKVWARFLRRIGV